MTDSNTRFVILTALQFDDTGDRALREAARIAQKSENAELHIVHAAAPSLATDNNGASTAIPAQLSHAPSKLREFVDRSCAGTDLKVIAHVRVGLPHEVVLQVASELRADMIVLGTHQRTGIGKLVLGSVAERVMREACCPVLVATPKSYPASETIDPPCPQCVEARKTSGDPTVWCERHLHGRLRPHVYTPSDRAPVSVLGT